MTTGYVLCYNANQMKTHPTAPATADQKRSRLFVVAVVGIMLVVIIIVVGLIYLFRRPDEYTPSSAELMPREVEPEYLEAAEKLFDGIDETSATKDLDSSLAYAWSHHQYYLATGDTSHLQTALKGLEASQTYVDQVDLDQQDADINPALHGLVCAMLKDIYVDNTLDANIKKQAQTLCAHAAADYWESEKMHEYHQRLEEGQASKTKDNSSLYLNDPEYIVQEVSKLLQDKLATYQKEGTFTWPDDVEARPLIQEDNRRRQLMATNNNYFYSRLYTQTDFDDTSDAAQRLRQQKALATFDWLWLLGQNISWYVNNGRFGEEYLCLLQQNLTAYLRSNKAGDIYYTQEMALTSHFAGVQTETCQALAFFHYNSDQDVFARDNNLISANLVEEGITPTVDKLYLAGLLTQEEQPRTTPSLTLDGTDIDTYEFSLPADFANIYNEITQEDLDAVNAMRQQVEGDSADESFPAMSEQEMNALLNDLDYWSKQIEAMDAQNSGAGS